MFSFWVIIKFSFCGDFNFSLCADADSE